MRIEDRPRAIDAARPALAASGRMETTLVDLGLPLVECGALSVHAVHDELRSRAVRDYVSPAGLAALEARRNVSVSRYSPSV